MLLGIRLAQFRNFERLELSFKDGLNAIVGPNAIGKTTVLEAIHFISIGRSFRTQKLQEVIRKGGNRFSLEAFFLKDGVEQRIAISYDGENKQVWHNDTSYTIFSPLLGLLPTVVYSPFDIELIHGAPSVRRRFLNILIAQSNPTYVQHLTRYAKAVNQRNALLRTKNLATIEIWEEELIRGAAVIQAERARVVQKISERAKQFYAELSGDQEEIEITYKPSPPAFDKWREREVLIGHTLVGPHRDDLGILLQELPIRNYASEGQKRTFIAALKLAETEHIGALLLIDDFGIHLDQNRKGKFEEKIASHSQLFLTSPFPIAEAKASHELIASSCYVPES